MIECKELNKELNLNCNQNLKTVGSNIPALLGLQSFVMVGGTQYHDANDFTVKELVNTSYFNSLTFTLRGNNGEKVGEVFLELLMCG